MNEQLAGSAWTIPPLPQAPPRGPPALSPPQPPIPPLPPSPPSCPPSMQPASPSISRLHRLTDAVSPAPPDGSCTELATDRICAQWGSLGIETVYRWHMVKGSPSTADECFRAAVGNSECFPGLTHVRMSMPSGLCYCPTAYVVVSNCSSTRGYSDMWSIYQCQLSMLPPAMPPMPPGYIEMAGG